MQTYYTSEIEIALQSTDIKADKRLNLKIANSRGKKPVINQIKKARTLLQDLLIEINYCEGRDELNKTIAILHDILEDNKA